jgi:hypothetical protein
MRGASLLKPAARRKEHEALGGAGIDRTSKAVAYVVCNQTPKTSSQQQSWSLKAFKAES